MNREGQGAGHKIAERGVQGSGKNDREKGGGAGSRSESWRKKNTAGEQDRRIELKEMNGRQGSGMQTAKIMTGNRGHRTEKWGGRQGEVHRDGGDKEQEREMEQERKKGQEAEQRERETGRGSRTKGWKRKESCRRELEELKTR